MPQEALRAEDFEEAMNGRIVIKRSKQARRLALRLDHKNRVFNLVVPSGTSLKRAYSFARKHEDWIEEKLGALPPLVRFEDGSKIKICGRSVTLDIYHAPERRSTSIELGKRYLRVHTNKEDPTQRIIRFLKELAREELSTLAHEKAGIIRKKIKYIRIGDMKSRWGSCTHDGRISLSWRLILAPYEAMDYVVAHEVAHMRHLDHSPKFWALCEDLSDHYEKGKNWMRRHGQDLMRYG